MNLAHYDIVYNRKKFLSPKGTAPVEVRIRLHRRYKYFTLFRVRPDQIDSKTNKLNTRYPNYYKQNKYLSDLLVQLENFELDLKDKNQHYTLEDFNDFFNTTPRMTFNEMVKRELDNANLKKSTIRQQRGFLKKLDAFNPKINMHQINYELLTKFETCLRDQKLSQNTIHKAFSNFNKFYNRGINLDLIEQRKNPFRAFNIKREPSKIQFIHYMQVQKIEGLDLKHEEEVDQIREIFLFGVYTGLRFSDLINLRKDQVEWGLGGECNIDMRMEKTRDFVTLPLHILFDGKPRKMLLKRRDTPGEYFFPRLSNQHVNRVLKIIGHMAGIKKPLTFHVSRHTFGTCLVNFEIPMETVQQLMGHKSVKQTHHYAKLLMNTVEDQLTKAFHYV